MTVQLDAVWQLERMSRATPRPGTADKTRAHHVLAGITEAGEDPSLDTDLMQAAERHVRRKVRGRGDQDRILDALGLTATPAKPAPVPDIPAAANKRQERNGSPRPDLTWQDHAACNGQDLDLFFGAEGERGPDRTTREQHAKHICRTCPVIATCRDHAFAMPEKAGVWGAMTAEERTEARPNWLRAQRRTRTEAA